REDASSLPPPALGGVHQHRGVAVLDLLQPRDRRIRCPAEQRHVVLAIGLLAPGIADELGARMADPGHPGRAALEACGRLAEALGEGPVVELAIRLAGLVADVEED